MSVASKLQIEPGQDVVVLRKPDDVALEGAPGSVAVGVAAADGAVVFVTAGEDLSTSDVEAVVGLAGRDALAWVAYPKAGKLGTDLNRDTLAALLAERGVQPVRLTSIDDTWSALPPRRLDRRWCVVDDLDSVCSPGGWRVPAGRRAAWDWLPPGGATARPDRVPVWLRIMYRTPFVDRYAYELMWFRGGWDVAPPEDLEPGATAGLVRSTPAPRQRRRSTVHREWRLVTLVVGLFDLAERHLRQRPPRRGPRGPRRWILLWRLRRNWTAGAGPVPNEQSMKDMAMRMQARHDAAIEAARRSWGPQIEAAAAELIRDGVTVLSLDGGQVRGRILRFWRGDSVLDLESIGSGGERGGTSKIRLTRQQETDPEVLTFYLLQQAAEMSSTENFDA